MAFNKNSGLQKYADLALVSLLIAIIALMILPLPSFLIDLLLGLNLGLSIILLMVAMYIPSALSLSVFPSLLLFTTLFRLSLNITTTRLILLTGAGGDIITTFGKFVVGGNFAVGAIVFLILTIVQFMVIAKGSERVAEVAARFTLDAMPGKQMSIDADMRAGVIDITEARKRRSIITRESQLFGAMDGAMKFVKGDSIAGLIVTVINLIGGISIGIMQKGLSAGQAVEKYSILTIGDGLVSQIPALMISITAGIIVTRVTDEENAGGHLGAEIGSQLMGEPKALLVSGFMVFLMGLIPGFPKLQFFTLALIIGGLGYSLMRKRKEEEAIKEATDGVTILSSPDEGGQNQDEEKKEGEEFSITVPILVDMSESIREHLNAVELNDEIVRVRKTLYHELGVPFPGIHLRFRNELEANSYSVMLQEVPISQGFVLANKIFVREPEDRLAMMGFDYERGADFIPGIETIWMDKKMAPMLDKAGLVWLSPSQVVTAHISFILKKHADEFLGLQEVKYLLTQMEDRFSELVKEAQRVMSLQKITEILQRLVQEQISIRNLRSILEALIEWGQKEKDPVLLTEYIRSSLRRQISYQYSGGMNVLSAYMLNPSLEETIRAAVRQTGAGSYLALAPETSQEFIDKVKEEIGIIPDMNPKPVLLTSMDIRRYVRKLIEADYYELPVLSYQDLTSEISIQPLARIAL
ncbi:MAG: type III secretion system export apparatus subunit SctV [Desulfovibrionaceae bacterium]